MISKKNSRNFKEIFVKNEIIEAIIKHFVKEYADYVLIGEGVSRIHCCISKKENRYAMLMRRVRKYPRTSLLRKDRTCGRPH